MSQLSGLSPQKLPPPMYAHINNLYACVPHLPDYFTLQFTFRDLFWRLISNEANETYQIKSTLFV